MKQISEVGLFPYVNEDALGLRDRIAYEFHRPLNMDESDYVFHAPQGRVYRALMNGRNVILSAPTSFGKSLVIDAMVALERFKNIVVVVPTLALIDETRKRLSDYSDRYKIITHTSQTKGTRNIYVLTQERVLERDDLDDVDFFVIDEFYKLSPNTDRDDDRCALLNNALYKLLKTKAQFYMLGLK